MVVVVVVGVVVVVVVVAIANAGVVYACMLVCLFVPARASRYQVNSTLPPPQSTAVPQPSTFTRRAVGKSDAELEDEENAAKKVQTW